MSIEEEREKFKKRIEKAQNDIFYKELAHTLKLWFDDPDLLIIKTIFDMGTFRFLTVSESCKKILGWDRSEMEGKVLDEFLEGEDLQKAYNQVNDNYSKGESVNNFVNVYKCAPGFKKKYQVMSWFVPKGKAESNLLCYGIPGLIITDDDMIKKIMDIKNGLE